MENTGDLIKRRRNELGLSQAEVADFVGVSRQMIRLYEHGAQPDQDKTFKLAEILKVNVSVFDPILGAVAQVDTSTHVHSIPIYPLESFLLKRRGNENMLRTSEGIHEVLTVAPAQKKCFAVRMTDDSMNPVYNAGDVLVIDPSAEPRDRCKVLVSFGNERAIVRFYTFRGIDRKGSTVYDLSTPNADHVTVTVNGENPGKVEGVVIERRTDEYNLP